MIPAPGAAPRPAARGDRILYLQYTNPGGYPPLQHSSTILAESGWRVRFLGAGMGPADVLRLPPHPRVDVRMLPFAAGALRQRWVYASDLYSTPVALLLSYLPGVRVLYHEHDSPQGTRGRSAFVRACLAARRRLGARAGVCVLPYA